MNAEQHDKIVMAVTMNTMCFMLMAYGYGFLSGVGNAQLSSRTRKIRLRKCIRDIVCVIARVS